MKCIGPWQNVQIITNSLAYRKKYAFTQQMQEWLGRDSVEKALERNGNRREYARYWRYYTEKKSIDAIGNVGKCLWCNEWYEEEEKDHNDNNGRDSDCVSYGEVCTSSRENPAVKYTDEKLEISTGKEKCRVDGKVDSCGG